MMFIVFHINFKGTRKPGNTYISSTCPIRETRKICAFAHSYIVHFNFSNAPNIEKITEMNNS